MSVIGCLGMQDMGFRFRLFASDLHSDYAHSQNTVPSAEGRIHVDGRYRHFSCEALYCTAPSDPIGLSLCRSLAQRFDPSASSGQAKLSVNGWGRDFIGFLEAFALSIGLL